MKSWFRLKPGWYLLIGLIIYGAYMTVSYARSQRTVGVLSSLQSQLNIGELQQVFRQAPAGLWFPIPGVTLPQEDSYLPGAPRVYRRGDNEGFDFYGNDAGVPIAYGQAVIASVDGIITRADLLYQEPSPKEWEDLLTKVASEGTSDTELDLLRGRQIWLKLEDGRELRYGHLSGIHPSIREKDFVYRGQVIGYVGNSGTDDGILDTKRGARLHFEIRLTDNSYFGQGLTAAAVRDSAKTLFNGP